MASTGKSQQFAVMKRGLLIPLIAFIIIPGLAVSAQAEISITQVTTNSYEDSSPHIVGNHLVWQGEVDGDWEIFLYNVATGEGPVQITHNRFDDISPQTDGNHVVWLGFSQPDGPDGEIFLPGGEVFLYNISNGQTTRITNDTNVDSPPRIADGKVVWASHAVGDSVEPGEIFLYDIATGVTEQLTNNTLDDSSPRINGESIVWVRKNSDGTTTLFVHDLTDGSTSPAPDGFVWPDSPQTDENLTVSTRHDGSDREVFVYNGDSRKYHQITANGFEDRYPSIGGNYVAWTSGGEIFLAGLPLMGRAATNVRQTGFTANWKAPAEGADRYGLDVSTTWNFSSCVAEYENLDVGNTTSYPVTGLMPDRTYHYRVRAVLGGKTSTNSDTIRVVTPERGKVTGPILMLLVLDEDNRPSSRLR
jgi:beta propeller repeat protein